MKTLAVNSMNIKKRLGKMIKTRTYKIKSMTNLLIVFLLMTSVVVYAQTNLKSVDYNSELDGTVEFHLIFDNDINKPDVFMTTQPPRLAFDMPNVYNDSGVKVLPVSQGSTRSIMIVSTGEKTRAVIDLLKAAHHELSVNGNELIVKIYGNKNSQNSTNVLNDNHYRVENVDFRRGENGAGKVIVMFNKPGALVNIRETADKIKLEISSTELPAELDNKLDVIDFATPVSFVDVRSRNGQVNIDISASGIYEHMEYQTGNQYVIEISEKVEIPENTVQGLDKEVEYIGNKINFTFQDIPVRSVLSLIADASQFNLVVSDSVQGNVTLRLIDVPWDQALDAVLNLMKLDKRQKDSVIWIAPADEIAAREKQILETMKDKEENEPLKTIYIQVNYAKADELVELIERGSKNSSGGASGSSANSDRGMLSQRGSVTFDERTNTLLVTDIPSKLRVVENLIKQLDVAVRQVQIESRIVIASDSFGQELGVKFGVNGSRQDSNGNIISTGGSLRALDSLNNSSLNGRLNSLSGSGLPNFTPGTNGSGIVGPTLGDRLNVNLPASSGASKWAFSILAADYLLDLELSALESEGRGEVISTPRIVTTNQTEASIRQGVQIPYTAPSTSGQGGQTTSVTTFKDAVLKLTVTPLITPDDRVDLTLDISKDDIGALVPQAGGGTIPSIDSRSIQTRVLVGNGQTIVLGGIYEQVKSTSKSKVPLLGDIPGLGALFRNRNESNKKVELLIFVTPTIIKESL